MVLSDRCALARPDSLLFVCQRDRSYLLLLRPKLGVETPFHASSHAYADLSRIAHGSQEALKGRSIFLVFNKLNSALGSAHITAMWQLIPLNT